MRSHTINLLDNKEHDSMRNLHPHAMDLNGYPGNRTRPMRHAAWRIGLRVWGFAESEVNAWIRDLPVLDGSLCWEIAHQRDGSGADMIIHLVRSSSPALGSFCWNSVGANDAIRASRWSSRVEMALFSGDVTRLPQVRYGLWAMAGTRPAESALHTLAQAVIVPQFLRRRVTQGTGAVRVVPRRLALVR
ncbi:hypothetical protein [Paraburkholderia xenovorans]|jgi:hypothetical protein|uniref:Uncharacterized protein n=1 Tax=Paraburkholderia xenovorans (strain LB400) TaxID=266265 RepID=Q13RU5_PARXL|nr:hypothetical protein [Paraburkholderia xenovorans]ABE33194.1 hypothetical protein Bxe_B2801 [Paraburkholderia xenovorans LB400]NPT35161.1 hypothetical protein [Paraburkholderia xenovorans]